MRRYTFLVICLLGILGTMFNGSIKASEKYIKVDRMSDFKLEIGAIIPQTFLDANQSSATIVTGSSQTLPKYNVQLKGINYEIGVDNEKTIAFITTTDENFSTPENIQVGMGLMEALHLSHDNMRFEKGWACYIELKSGWNAAFKLADDNTFNIFDSVAFIFMKKKL